MPLLPGGHAEVRICADGTVTAARVVDGYRASVDISRLVGKSILDLVVDTQEFLRTIITAIETGRPTTVMIHLRGRRIPRIVRLVPQDDAVIAYFFKKKKNAQQPPKTRAANSARC